MSLPPNAQTYLPGRGSAPAAAAFPPSSSLMHRQHRCFARNRKGVADDRLENEAVRSRREAVAGAELNVDVFHFEIGDRVQLLRSSTPALTASFATQSIPGLLSRYSRQRL